MDAEPLSLTVDLQRRIRAEIRAEIRAAGGWLPFDRYMELALYCPGLGYYAHGSRKFGLLPGSGSDFVTAPELTPLFGQALARQLAQALDASQSAELWEFGAGSGALAAQLLNTLGDRVRQYRIVDLSGALRERQHATVQALAPEHAAKVQWLDRLPDTMQGVVVGNEVLDAMPVKLLRWQGGEGRDSQGWQERGVVEHERGFGWEGRPTALRPPVQAPDRAASGDSACGACSAFAPGYLTEIHPQAEAFVRTLADKLTRGAVFLLDYGFPEREYYHPQRGTGTLVCHRAHQADTDPLADVGLKDITAHVNFTGIALAGQDAGLDVLGYTTQGRFLMNCGIMELLRHEAKPDAPASAAYLRAAAAVQKLLAEHEMGELFKVIAFGKGLALDPLGFAAGDRTHTL